MKALTLDQILEAVGGRCLGDPLAMAIDRVATDSRQVRPGDLYVPIVGERFDGHDFIDSAFKAGASLVFTHKAMPLEPGQCGVLVQDTKLALGSLAAWYRRRFDIPVIGITGSVGKTSTKEMIAAILSTKYKVHKTSGNYNNDIGLPLTLLGLEEDHEVAVIEMGMNHFGEIDYLAGLAEPTIGMITNIGVSHIEFLGSRQGILKAKTELLPHIRKGGKVILNGDDDLLLGVTETFEAKKYHYGASAKFDSTMTDHQVTEAGGQQMTATTPKATYDIAVDYPGEHILHNALGGILIGEWLGLSKKEIIEGIGGYQPTGQRLKLMHLKEGVTLIDDAYNASVDSMGSALKTLQSLSGGRETLAILGSMFEMGDYAEEGHRAVGALVATHKPHRLFAVGEEGKWVVAGAVDSGYPAAQIAYFPTQAALLEVVKEQVDPNTTVLLKASRGMHLEQTRDKITERYEALP